MLVLTLSTGCNSNKKRDYLVRTDWCDNVKNNINDFIYKNNKDNFNSSSNNYVVFNFDNTCSILDIEEQCVAYQLTHMAFVFEDATALGNMLKLISIYLRNYLLILDIIVIG